MWTAVHSIATSDTQEAIASYDYNVSGCTAVFMHVRVVKFHVPGALARLFSPSDTGC